ncbi:MAG: hypothetical protein JXM70_06345 [Pirellulales bacterium]|nr:hypothetical protein [Pirellulales bacterium]
MADTNTTRPGATTGFVLTGVGLGACLGALTNAVSGRISPTYFRNVMRWEEINDIPRAAIAQGIFEGILFGLAFSIIFVIVVGIVARARCPYWLGVKYLLFTVAAALVCWMLGGLTAMGLAALSPELFQNAFRGVPDEFGGMIRYAWVGGSIQGLTLGGLAGIVVAAVLFRAKWRTMVEEHSTGANS